MDADKVSLRIKSIKKKAKLVVKDHQNANLLLDLLKYTQSKNDAVVCASCESLAKVFGHHIATDPSFIDVDSEKITVPEADISKEVQFSLWLKEQYTTACDVLSDHLCHVSSEVQVAAFKSLVSLMSSFGKDCPQGQRDKLMEGIVSQLLSEECDQSDLMQHLPLLLAAWGENSQMILLCLVHIKKTLKSLNQHSPDVKLCNYWRIIKQLSNYDMDDKCKGLLTVIVIAFLKNRKSTSLYREILTGISTVMEKMSNPLRLADFLSESFNIGGAISLMSLHSLFTLMHKYNLNYPDFYTKLYSMFDPQIFSAKYRARFFHLADTFLTSTHLPAYLVAAFAKRLARLCLYAPVSGVHIAVPFILNLLSRHPACEVLLHRTEAALELDCDPFLPEETNLSKCKAIDSCLWELQTLERHYDPSLSHAAQKRHIAEKDLSALLENTSSDFIASEAKKIKKDVPVTFERPRHLELFKQLVL